MVRYKMLARDVNSNPTQLRTWIVANNPDLQAQYYYGPKSGSNSFVDVTAYAIEDGYVIADFDLPLPSMWMHTDGTNEFPIRKVLSQTLEDSHFAVIDGYAYMFGGRVTNKIYRASISNPADWTDTGAILPTPLYGGSLAIVNGFIYIFGGNNGQGSGDGQGAVSTIFSAPISNPLSWTNLGNLLPYKLYWSGFGMVNGQLFLFGGRSTTGVSNVILNAPATNPLLWTDTAARLPTPVFGSICAQINGNWMLFGGLLNGNIPTSSIWSAPVTNPLSWSVTGSLPYATAFSQFVTMGNDGYLIGPMAGAPTNFTSILQCKLNNPNAFIDTLRYVPGVLSHSQITIIYDRIWLFGGSGETAIFACSQLIKYDYYNATVQAYANATRVIFPATDNLGNPFQALGIPYWRTDYSMSPPPPAPNVPPILPP